MNHSLYTTFPWMGRKVRVLKPILSVLNAIDHELFVDAYGGSGTVLLNKPQTAYEIFNDIDEDIVNFFRVMADPQSAEVFIRRACFMPISRALYHECLVTYKHETDPVVRAVKWYYVTINSIVKRFGSGISYKCVFHNPSKHLLHNLGLYQPVFYQRNVERLSALTSRLLFVQLENRCALQLLKTYDRPTTLFYLDPPYPKSTRKQKSIYRYETPDEHHRLLVERVLTLSGKVVLSSYQNEIYQPLLDNGWRLFAIPTKTTSTTFTRSPKSTETRVECLYVNPSAYSFLKDAKLDAKLTLVDTERISR